MILRPVKKGVKCTAKTTDILKALFIVCISGGCHVFGCANEKLFVMKVLNEDTPEKYHVTKCQPSLDADYLGLVLESMLPL